MKIFLKSTMDDFTVGLQYSPIRKYLTIGGHIKFADKILTILTDYFIIDLDKCTGKLTCPTKMKYEYKGIDPIYFSEALVKLRTDGIENIPTNNLNRIWW
jgi:hypothetical protein